MNVQLIHTLRKKEDKNEVEHEFLKQSFVLSMISEILVDVSKLHLTGDEGIQEIRKCLQENM